MREDIPATPKRKICIVGFADGHRDLAPWDDPEMEFWGLNRLHQVLGHRVPKFTHWFELHSLQKFYLDNNDTVHAAFLKEFPGPVYLRPDDMGLMDIPNGEPFPISELLDEFPNYFTNSVSWMLALAILRLRDAAAEFQEAQRNDDDSVPAPEVHIYGVDMAQDTLQTAEYAEQRPSCEYFLGHLAAMGVSVHIPAGSDLLLSSHKYGFDDTDPIRGKDMARIAELQGRQNQIIAQLEQGDREREKLVAGKEQLSGAIQQLQYGLRNLTPPAEVVPDIGEVKQEITLETLAGGLAAVQQQIAALTPVGATNGED